MGSNILDVFNPPSKSNPGNNPDNSTDKKLDEPCLQCLTVSSAVMIGAGTYLASGLVFRQKEGAPPNPNVTKNWKFAVKGFGSFVLGLGIYRGIAAARMYFDEIAAKEKKLE